MDFKNEIKKFIECIETRKDTAQTEEATKMSLIIPFFQLLGYDVFNPLEFCPEYTADIGIKKGEKVDFAILKDGQPIILIEAKAVGKKLDKHSSQLFRYFVATPSRFAILTNGISYKFFTDLDESNKMDKEPFLDINLLNIKDNQILQLNKFRKENLNISDILDSAALLKYNNIFKNYFDQQIKAPSDDFVKLFLQPVYKGAKTQAVIEKFRPILSKALTDYVNEALTDRIQSVLTTPNMEQLQKASSAITTNEQWDILTYVKEILNNVVDISKISLKNTESYTAILYENSARKWLCRLILSNTQKVLILPGINKKELKYQLEKIEDITTYSSQIIEVATRYLHPAAAAESAPAKELLQTKWGTYEMPDPYVVNFTRGPRQDLTKIK